MQAVIFDLDGTLWNATEHTYEIWNRVFERYPEVRVHLTQADKQGFMGKTMEEIGALLMPGTNIGLRRAIMDEIGVAEVEFLWDRGGVLYDGLRSVLDELGRTRDLYIVSNSQDGYVQAFLHAHGLEDRFRDIEMSGRTGLDKGDNIRLIMARNAVGRAVYVGDTEGDEAAAAKAGIPFIHAAYGFGTAVSPDAVIRDIAELPGVLNAMAASPRP